MGWINLNSILLQLLSILASVHCIKEHDIYPFSEALNSGMESETNPCNDFYQFSCGKWIETNPVFHPLKHWNVYRMSLLSTIIKVKEIFDNPNIDNKNKKRAKERKLYKACMNEDYSPKEGYVLMAKILYGIPRERWQDVLEYYATNFSAFHLFHIKLDETKRLQIVRPRFSESNTELFKNMVNKAMVAVKWLYEATYNSFFGDIRPLNDAIKESLSFMEFINQITLNGNETFEVFSILELQQFYDYECPSEHAKIDWLQFFQKLAEGSGINFTLNDELSVDIQYLISLCKRLIDTPAHAIVNYLQYNFILDDNTQFHKKFYTSPMNYTERYVHCIRTLAITEGVTKEILKSHIPQETKKFVYDMFKNIQSALMTEIENSWLVNSLKEKLLNITRGITYKFGTLIDPLKNKLGKSATYKFKVGRVAFENELNFRRAQIINILQVYDRVYTLHRAKRHLECNAVYSWTKNKFIMDVAMLFPTHFYKNEPIAFNYGRLGFTIGHEISHAFNFAAMVHYIDCIPSNDERKEMELMLQRKKSCFVEEFNRLGTNGERTLEENMADTQGLKLAWKGMNALIQDREETDEVLPISDDWNKKKLFFVSFANMYCSNLERRADSGDDIHSPSVIRTLGTLMNMNEFEETYDCAKGDYMNPIRKCDLWDES